MPSRKRRRLSCQQHAILCAPTLPRPPQAALCPCKEKKKRKIKRAKDRKEEGDADTTVPSSILLTSA
jgi:hypothetical protein